MENSSSKPKPPAKLKVFHTVQKNFAFFGIDPYLLTPKKSFNKRILLGFLIQALAAISTFIFIYHEAKSFTQYTQSIYMFSLSIGIILVIVNMTFKLQELLMLYKGAESIANTSE